MPACYISFMSHRHFNHLSDPDQPSIEGAPGRCEVCGAPLCLRKQVINLALGNTDEMLCLKCLGEDSDKTAEEVLVSVKEYVYKRDCFRKEWQRYASMDFCPDPKGCFPGQCFKGEKH